ncbi:MAG: D-alanine--D-alanine ligase [bacterium]|nr:D-alanine--D-alanine ligase [bacterium]
MEREEWREKLQGRRIAVLMGGQSREREISLRSGERVLDSLKRQGFFAIPLDIDNNIVENLKNHKIDIVFIALHGRYGEDGTIQGLLETMNIPYTGSGVLASSLGMNKIASKRIFKACNIPTPSYYVIDLSNSLQKECENILKELSLPLIIKPISEGSSLGVKIIRDEKKLKSAIEDTIHEFGDAFVEKYINGKSVTVGILGVDKNLRVLPILELQPRGEFYDYKAKYTKGETRFIIPARLEKEIYQKTEMVALSAHKALGCHGFSRVDIMVSNEGTPFVHDVNTIPGLTHLSDLPAEAEHIGISYDELIFEILCSAINKPEIRCK